MNNVLALAGVVIKELYRRKDFYVLFVLTALITMILGSVKFFNDDRIVRYLKDACLLLIWISSLVIAVTTTARQIPAERESRTIFPLLAKPVSRAQLIVGKIFGLLAGLRIGVDRLLLLFRRHHRLAGTCLAAGNLFPGPLAALDLSGHRCRLGFARVGGLHRAFLQRHHLFHRCGRDHVLRWSSQRRGHPHGRRQAGPSSIPFITAFRIWSGTTCVICSSITGVRIPWLACAAATLYGLLYSAFLLGAAWLVFRRKTLTV